MKNSKVRFGIIGAGAPNQNVGGNSKYSGVAEHHAGAIQEYGELVAIADLKDANARFLANRFGVKDIYSDYRRLLERKDIDAVTIATPSGTHADIAINAAQAGKHILVEKPIDVTVAKAEQAVIECEQQKVKMAVGFHHRFGIVKDIKEAIDGGEVGKLIFGNAFCKRYRIDEYFKNSSWRGTWALDGGGALMNQGIHVVDSFQWIFGEVESLFGYYDNLKHPYVEVEDVAVASVRFKNKSLGMIESTTCCYPDLSDRLEIHGEKGSIIIEGYPMEIKLRESLGSKEHYKISESKEQPVMYSGMHHGLIKDLIDAIKDDREPQVNGREGLKSLKIICAIYESSRQKKEIFLA